MHPAEAEIRALYNLKSAIANIRLGVSAVVQLPDPSRYHPILVSESEFALRAIERMIEYRELPNRPSGHPQNVNLKHWLGFLIDRYKYALAPLEFIFDVPRDCPVKIDHRALERIVSELLDNAIRYTPEGGCIHLVGKSNRIEISNSVEMSDEAVLHCFEPFWKGTDDRKGIGLGLPLARRYGQLSRIGVRLEKRSDEWTTFVVRLSG